MTTAHSGAVCFPPSRSGVLLPLHDRQGAARGITLYTASKRRVLVMQWLAWGWLRLVGASHIPGARTHIDIPYLPEIAAQLATAFSSVAVYQRRDTVREGTTLLAMPTDAEPVLIKIRPEPASLRSEQLLLTGIIETQPKTFRVPRPLGFGQLPSGQYWSAQEMVFSAPHFPCTWLPRQVLDELERSLAASVPADPDAPPSWSPAHRDLTPWNLRRDHRGQLWLFDWEDAGYAPPSADFTYFHASLGLIRPRRPMPTVDHEAAAYWTSEVQSRLDAGHPDQNLVILKRLRIANTH